MSCRKLKNKPGHIYKLLI